MTRVLVPLADGCEEMEAVIAIDTLRRAGWDVVAAGLREGPVTASRRVRLLPDASWDEVDPASFDILLVPGGAKGVERLAEDERVLAAVRRFHERGGIVAAVCAGPLVLQAAGILDGCRVTSHPAVAPELTAATRVDEAVVVDGRLVTSQGAGTSFGFALTLIELVEGRAKAEEVARGMVVRTWP